MNWAPYVYWLANVGVIFAVYIIWFRASKHMTAASRYNGPVKQERIYFIIMYFIRQISVAISLFLFYQNQQLVRLSRHANPWPISNYLDGIDQLLLVVIVILPPHHFTTAHFAIIFCLPLSSGHTGRDPDNVYEFPATILNDRQTMFCVSKIDDINK